MISDTALKPEQTWCLYILKGVSTSKLYTGITTNPEARLRKHNSGRGAKFTRYGGPWSIVYLEVVGSKGDALRRERAVKKLSKISKTRFICSYNKEHLEDNMDIFSKVAARYAFEVFAMSRDEALVTLGFNVGDNPTGGEVAKAYKLKALENHPDRGGDPSKMVAVNVAKMTLDQETPEPTYKSKYVKPDIVIPGVSFETMASQFSPNTAWFAISSKFLEASTQLKNVGKYWTLGEELPGVHYWIALLYGRSETSHVFVAIKRRFMVYYSDITTGKITQLGQNFEANVESIPLAQDISSNYMAHFKSVASFWSDDVYEGPVVDVFSEFKAPKPTEESVFSKYYGKGESFAKILKKIKSVPTGDSGALIKKVPVSIDWMYNPELAKDPKRKLSYQVFDYFIKVGSKTFQLTDETIRNYAIDIIPTYCGWPKNGRPGSKMVTRMREQPLHSSGMMKNISYVLKMMSEGLTTEDPWLKNFLLKASEAWKH